MGRAPGLWPVEGRQPGRNETLRLGWLLGPLCAAITPFAIAIVLLGGQCEAIDAGTAVYTMFIADSIFIDIHIIIIITILRTVVS